MAWTNLTFAYGSKLTSAKMTQLVDNFTAMGSGSASAPRIAMQALEPYIAGSYTIISSLSGSSLSTSYAKVSEVYIPRSGSLKISMNLYNSDIMGDGTTAYGRIYRNGSAVGTARSTQNSSGNYASYVEDISGWATGDLCQLYLYNNSGSATHIANGSFSIGVSNPINPVEIEL